MKKTIREQAEVTPESSLDAQVLAFFTKADRSAIKDDKTRLPLSIAGMEETLRRKKMRHLFEAEEEEEDKPVFNVETFASEVARLLENPTALLEMEDVICKMAKNYVKNAYDEETSLKLMAILEEEYDYGGTPEDKQNPKMGSNFAVGARTPSA
jgi:hypothetical protein